MAVSAKNNVNSRPTIYWLAEHAGVSVATISRAMRNDPDVNINTRKRIRELAEQVGWSPSPIASRLAGGKTGMLAMLVPTIKNPVFTALADHVMQKSRENDYEVLLAYSELEYEREHNIINSFQNAYVDGFIIVPEFWSENKSQILKLRNTCKTRPIIIRSEIEPDCPLDSVFVDFKDAGLQAARHLISLGHSDICYFGIVPHWQNDARIQGFKEAMEEVGLEATLDMLVDSGMTIKKAYDAACKLLCERRPTAIIVHSDYLALAVLQAATKFGLKVPKDISIISFDGIEIGRYGAVSLTTFAQPVDKIADELVKCLLNRISGNQTELKRKKFKMELIEGQSTAAPAAINSLSNPKNQ